MSLSISHTARGNAELTPPLRESIHVISSLPTRSLVNSFGTSGTRASVDGWQPITSSNTGSNALMYSAGSRSCHIQMVARPPRLSLLPFSTMTQKDVRSALTQPLAHSFNPPLQHPIAATSAQKNSPWPSLQPAELGAWRSRPPSLPFTPGTKGLHLHSLVHQ